MKIDFYHIDAFEVANYEPIWRQLREKGVDASLVAVPDSRNTASAGWFNFEQFERYCTDRAIPFSDCVHADADLGVTTQNAAILRDYSKRVRLMYSPAPHTPGWLLQQQTVQPFDAVLVHGQFHVDWFSRWLPREQLPIIGYPRYDDFFSGKLSRAAIRARWGVNDKKPVLAFLPTWANNTAFDSFFPVLMKLTEQYQIVLRPHHCTLRMELHRMALMQKSGLLILDGAFDLPEVYMGADIVLSDVRSGSLFEALACDVPAVGMVLDEAELTGWLAERAIEKIAPLCLDPNHLERFLEIAVSSTALAVSRRSWADYHVAYRDGSAAAHAAEALIRLASPSKPQIVVPAVYAYKVSVVLPTYNHLEFLPSAVNGILSQTLTSFELIIVNDGSTDDTQAYLSALADPRVKVINRKNGGLPSALNRGFAEAGGEYLTWTSADNVTGPAWLEQLVAGLDAAPASVGFVYSGFALIDAAGAILAIRRRQKMQLDGLIAKNPGMASFLYRATVARKVGTYDEALTGAEDWDMWLRILEVCDAKYLDDVQYFYRVHGNSMTSSIPDKVLNASHATVHKLRLRHGNAFDLNRIYPCLRFAPNQPLAQWQAHAKLGALLIESPFCPYEWAVELLVAALRLLYTPQVHKNLVVLLCRNGRWDLALFSLDEFRFLHSSQDLDNLRSLVETHSPAMLDQIAISHVADLDLVFDPGHGNIGK